MTAKKEPTPAEKNLLSQEQILILTEKGSKMYMAELLHDEKKPYKHIQENFTWKGLPKSI